MSILSFDKPFGIELWPIFDTFAAKATHGAFVPSEFEFVAGKLPLSTLEPVLYSIAAYYFIVFGGYYFIKKLELKPLVLNALFSAHNLFLTTASLVLLTLMVEQLVPIIYHHGLFYSICNTRAWTQELVTLYYLNYLIKFVEFIDTFFLVVKQKKLTFLHTYHHGATALLCYTQLVGVTSISWVPISLNLGVHVVMYWYYFLASRGIRVWWKEWVTRFQIMQFILDLGFVYFASYQKFAYTYFKDVLPYCGDCAGTMVAAVSGCAILSSYLVLFIAFYIEVYRKQGKKSRYVKKVRGGVAAKVNEYVLLEDKQLASGASSRSSSPVTRNLRSRKA
ncbi:Fatty acyl-CoA elongase/Polyunsaturated fatty acid specific elongation enzyme [Komagataella kurtzmanii]|nr:Fatty acyl-CoA elongase/Polyunsaturated fatty acid specific elongation enzyme [Komagataella kurtzmanii]